MDKIWYIKLHGNREGPYNVMDLRRDRRITPDTLVWRQGFDKWQQIRYVPELQVVFEDAPSEKEEKLEFSKIPDDDEIVLDMRGNKDPHRWLWFFLLGILLVYIWATLWF